MWNLIAWIATVGGLLGAGLVAAGRPLAGQVVWCVGNPLWVAWAVAKDVPQTVLLFGVYATISAVGVVRGWQKRKGGDS